MQYELKANKVRVVISLVLSAATFIVSFIAIIKTGKTNMQLYSVFIAVCAAAMFIALLKDLKRRIAFNKTGFYFKGKTYVYEQIEKISVYAAHHGQVSYSVHIDGKRAFVFDKHFDGADEFLRFLNAHNVPGTPRDDQ